MPMSSSRMIGKPKAVHPLGKSASWANRRDVAKQVLSEHAPTRHDVDKTGHARHVKGASAAHHQGQTGHHST